MRNLHLGLIVVCLFGPAHLRDIPESRNKRYALQSCTTTPQMSETVVADRNQMIKLSCNVDTTVQTCTWTHNSPLKETRSNSYVADVICTGSMGDNGKDCKSTGTVTDTRVKFDQQPNRCGITISNSRPEDTGVWRLSTAALPQTQNPQAAEFQRGEFKVYTYNDSLVSLTDKMGNQVVKIETAYNFNVKNQRWEVGKSDWETLEFRCSAQGGRPIPKISWYIENNNNDGLQGAEGFTVTESMTSGGDMFGFLKNVESTITFRIDNNFIKRLEKHSINTNPANGIISFQLRCDAVQNMVSNPNRPFVQIDVRKSYDDGNLAAGTVGIIVGVIVAVLVLVVIVGVLIFAKTSQRWCFAESDYKSPNNSRPRTAGAGPGPGGKKPTQVHSRGGINVSDNQQLRSSRGSSSTTSGNESRINANPLQKHKTTTNLNYDNYQQKAPPKLDDSGRSSHSPASSIRSMESDSVLQPPRRPPKPQVNQENRKSFMNDPRNRVLPTGK